MQTAHRTSSPANGPAAANNNSYKFPNLPDDSSRRYSEDALTDSDHPLPALNQQRTSSLNRKDDSWHPRRTWGNATLTNGTRRPRQKSLSEALRTIHNRRASMSENAHEIAEALKAPISPTLIALCGLWYMTSICSNATSKAILTAFKFPVTLTVVQFAFVSSLCVISSWLAHLFPTLQTMIPALRYKIQRPSRDLIMTTLPLTAFQIGGHILNSDAMSRIPVSLVHTIKGLSPLFTVLAYRLFFHIHYPVPTYLSLVPLTLGVIMACSANLSGDFLGLVYALGSALLFVTQNIVSKKLFNEAARAENEGIAPTINRKKPDKLNLLCYSSALALFFTLPIWLLSEAMPLLRDLYEDGTIELARKPGALDHTQLIAEFVFNGIFHFAQSLVAFVLLSMVSPVTYSVASLIKRVFVISFAVVWFGNPLTNVQGAGILMTFVGLYLYDRTKDESRADRRAKMLHPRGEQPLLPIISEDRKPDAAVGFVAAGANGVATVGGVSAPPHAGSGPAWLAPGTKAEQTWKPHDASKSNGVTV